MPFTRKNIYFNREKECFVWVLVKGVLFVSFDAVTFFIMIPNYVVFLENVMLII